MEHPRGGARLHLLAGFEIRLDGVALELKPSSQRLLAFLALAGRATERAYTAFRLWPDRSESRAMANLRSSIWRIRQQPAALVETTSTHIRLDHSVWVDARDGFLEPGEPGAEAVVAEDAHALMSAELLPDWYDDWIVVERERLRQLRLHRLEAWCRHLIDERRCGEAIDLALRSVAIEPLRESAHRLVIQAHLAEGNVSEALRQYRECRQVLTAGLGVEPSADLRSLVVRAEGAARQGDREPLALSRRG